MKSDKQWEWQEVADHKIIAETIWMGDRPRTWREWISMFLRDLFS